MQLQKKQLINDYHERCPRKNVHFFRKASIIQRTFFLNTWQILKIIGNNSLKINCILWPKQQHFTFYVELLIILPSFSVWLDMPHVYHERLLALSARPVLPGTCCRARTQVIIICVLNNVNIIIVVNNEQSIPRSCLTSRVIDSQTYVGSGLVMASRLLFDSGRFKQINFNLLSFLFSQLFGDRSRHGHWLLCHNAGNMKNTLQL